MGKKGNSFIEFANNAPAKSEPVTIKEPTLRRTKLGFAEKLASLKMAAIESAKLKKNIDRDIEIHKRLVSFLSSITETGKIEDGEDSRFILNAYALPNNTAFVCENGKVIKKRSGYLGTSAQFAIEDLREYLSDSKNIKRIKKCPYCGLFFIAKDAKRKICYGMSCQNKYHKDDMKRRRDADPVRYC